MLDLSGFFCFLSVAVVCAALLFGFCIYFGGGWKWVSWREFYIFPGKKDKAPNIDSSQFERVDKEIEELRDKVMDLEVDREQNTKRGRNEEKKTKWWGT